MRPIKANIHKPQSALIGKLKSRRGASLIIALIFFLLCLTLVAVILNATGVGVYLIPETNPERQDYLTASSAAELIRDELLNLSCEITKTIGITHDNGDCDGTPGAEVYAVYGFALSKNGNAYRYTSYNDGTASESGEIKGIRKMLKELAEQVYETGHESSAGITINDRSGIFETIEANFTMAPDYGLEASLRFENSETVILTLTFGTSGTNRGTAVESMDHVFYDSEGDEQTCRITITRETLQTGWNSCVISKGGTGPDEE